MSAVIINGTDLQFGIAQDESGVVIERHELDAKVKEKTIPNKVGETVGLVLYDEMADITVSGFAKGSSGLMAVTLGGEFAPANATAGFGVTGGKIVVKSARITEALEEFKRVEVNMTRYPNIPSS